jgi:hypothetical protein
LSSICRSTNAAELTGPAWPMACPRRSWMLLMSGVATSTKGAACWTIMNARRSAPRSAAPTVDSKA